MNRQAWIDNARILSCFAVVLLHVAGAIVYQDPAATGSVWWAGNFYNSLTRWSVPFFLMITGALLLAPEKQEPLALFFRKRFGRILVPLVAWTLIYAPLRVHEGLSQGGALSVEFVKLLKAVVAGQPYYHLWYLYMLAGLYLFLPIVRFCVRAAPFAELRVAVALWLGVSVATTAAWSFSGPHGERFSLFLGSFFPFAPYCLAGYLIAVAPPAAAARRLTAAAAALAAATLLGSHALRDVPADGRFYCYTFTSATTLPLSLALFSLSRRLARPLVGGRLTAELSALSFGIYLLHPAMLKLLDACGIGPRMTNPFAAVPITAALAFLLSALCCAGIARTPFLRKII